MKNVLLVERNEGICTLTLNRAESQNRLNLELMTRLHEEFQSQKIVKIT